MPLPDKTPDSDALEARIADVERASADMQHALLLHVALTDGDVTDGDREASQVKLNELLSRMRSRLALAHGRRK